MIFGYAVVDVPDVLASVEFFEKAFGLKRRFVHDSSYGEMETGSTALAFATHELGASNLPGGYVRASHSDVPLRMEIRWCRRTSPRHTQRQFRQVRRPSGIRW
jgi:hypothetical protein